ncbi:acyl-CoA thioesterase [Desulfoprunum benzoelyticum]|uniref:Thioesterase-3 n=1 Tax=Desulfoprunum benzoelyticum TaxID=1506996 RepID=A0A840UR02_9BACT|nr:thioesterase family protein [Desulfoprunum benzoelyticum]MBB5347073.1 thioesterase-3 [Desulfoprunum benzoelyticum]MBM9529767.1 acyl-CoA thioesterase [Desulfoprunum benzoelyticum]
MEYLTEIKVRGYHADFYGHVNNARYLEFFEEDRWAHLESNIDLMEWVAKGQIFLVVNINVNYRKAVGVGEIINVSTEIEKIGSKSAVLLQKIVLKRTGEVAADARITFVIADRSGRAMALEGEVREQIERLGSSVLN